MSIDYHYKVTNVVFDGIDHDDYPDFCDAYIVSADLDGEPMTEDEIEQIDENFKYQLLMDYLY